MSIKKRFFLVWASCISGLLIGYIKAVEIEQMDIKYFYISSAFLLFILLITHCIIKRIYTSREDK